MRILLYAFAMIIGLDAVSQTSDSTVTVDYRDYLAEAIEMMEILHIPIRPNYEKDVKINFVVNGAIKGAQTELEPITIDTNVIYSRILIRLSSKIFTDLQLHNGSNDLHFANATLIHEVSHVLQYPDTVETNTGDVKHDLNTRVEIESGAVSAFYMIGLLEPNLAFQLIATFGGDRTALRKKLLELWYKEELSH